MNLKPPKDKTRLASSFAVAKSLGIAYTSLFYWIASGAPHPEFVRSANGREQMLWSAVDIEALTRWASAHKKRFRKNGAAKLEDLIRRHSQEIEKELGAPEPKRPDALTLIAQSVHKDLQRRKEKLSPSVVAEIVADALCEQTHGFSPSNELRAALVEAVMPSVVSGLNLLN